MSTRPPRGRQKPRKEAASPPPLKVVVRRLPPNLPEDIFHSSIAQWHKQIDWSEYIAGKLAPTKLEKDKFSRAYLKFRKQQDCADFIKRYHGHLFVSGEKREYRACAEVAPFQRLAKPLSNAAKAKDTLSGTIEQDPAYIAFLESLKTVVPHVKEDAVVSTKITPLIEHLRLQKAKNEEKAKARRAKEAATKGKQQEEKKKAAQAQADADTARMRENAANAKQTNGKGKSGKETHKKDDSNADAGTKKNAKTARNKTGDKSAKPSTNGNKSAGKQAVPTTVSNPSPLAQQRAPKGKAAETPKPTNGDAKPARAKKAKKKDASKSEAKHNPSKNHAPVDISGPTPAEMAALAKGKT